MLLSLDWLKQYVEVKEKSDKVAELFTMAGFEVERIIDQGRALRGVVIGRVLERVKHPNADKLSLCKVDVGKGEPLSIVCGAPNVEAGQTVPVATVGTTLPNGLIMERRKIRGEVSEGMICAEDELGLADKRQEGIMILENTAKPGMAFAEALGLDDVVLDIAVSPNRPDGLSVLGLAREYAALTGRKYKAPKVRLKESTRFFASKEISVRVLDKELCPHYTARVIKNVKIGRSPVWLQSRLRAAGQQPINNVVDIGNYVMLEYGQPLHMFDLAKVSCKKIMIRRAGGEKEFFSLDQKKRALKPSMLMIADTKQSIAIAGVIGGQNSQISADTKDIVIESAVFKPVSIRKTRQELGLVTEASIRFEKGLWPGLSEQASARAAQLLVEMSGGEAAKGLLVVGKNRPVVTVITTTLEYINQLIGFNFTFSQIKKYLEKLYFKVSVSAKTIRVTVPAFRPDVTIPADVVEEVGRLHGWNMIEPAPIVGAIRPVPFPEHIYWTRAIRRVLVACGLTEVISYSFYNKSLQESAGAKHYRITNPTNPEQEYLRVNLLSQLFEVNRKNYQQSAHIKLFEIGKLYFYKSRGLPDEQLHIAATIYHKKKTGRQCFQEIKSVLQELVRGLGVPVGALGYAPLDGEVDILLQGKRIGRCGLLQDATTANSRVGEPKAYFEIDASRLMEQAAIRRRYSSVSRYPSVKHDMTFVTPRNTDYLTVVDTVRKLDRLIISFAAVKALYAQSGEYYSASFSLVLQASDHTLTSSEIEAVRHKVTSTLAKKFNMKLKQ